MAAFVGLALPVVSLFLLMHVSVRARSWVLPQAECKQKLPDLDEDKIVAGPLQAARRADMDMNGHVNNVVFLAWALEAVPSEVYDNCVLYEVRTVRCRGCTHVWVLVRRCQNERRGIKMCVIVSKIKVG